MLKMAKENTKDIPVLTLVNRLVTQMHVTSPFVNMTQIKWAWIFEYMTAPIPCSKVLEPQNMKGDLDNRHTNNKLIFVPRFLTLDSSKQCLLLTLFIQHRLEIPTNCLRYFCRSLTGHDVTNRWTNMLISELSRSENTDPDTENYDINDILSCGVNTKISASDLYKLCNKQRANISIILGNLSREDASNTSGKKTGYDKDGIRHEAQRKIICEKSVDDNVASMEELLRKNEDHMKSVENVGVALLAGGSGKLTDKRDRDSCDDDVTGNVKKRKINGCLEVEPITIEDSPLPQSQSFMYSQVSQVVTDCPLFNHYGSSLSADLLTRLSSVKEAWKEERTAYSMETELRIFLEATPTEMEEMCDLLEVPALSDTELSTACQHIHSLTGSISHANVIAFTRSAFAEKLLNLSRPITRSLLATLLSHASVFPRAVTETIIPPFVDNPSGLSVHQADCVCRLISDVFSPLSSQHLLESLLDADLVMSEGLVNLLHTMFNKQTPISEQHLTGLVSSLDAGTVDWSADLKFAKLLLAFVKNYSSKFASNHVTSLAMIAAHNKTFLKKSLQNAINKLT